MGCVCCKCTPRWQNDEDIVCAYVYEECACCRPRRYILRGAAEEDCPWNFSSHETARKLLEGNIYDPYGLPVSIAHEVPKGCCGYEIFEAAVARLNREWIPKQNRDLEPYGWEVDAFEWVEYRYISHGQYGGHTQPVPHLCIRVRRIGVGETQRSNADDYGTTKAQ